LAGGLPSCHFGRESVGRFKSSHAHRARPIRLQLLTYSYDAANNRTLVKDSQGGVATSVYDVLNRLTSRQFGGTTPLRIDETYTARDQVASESRYTDVAGTHLVGTSSFTYDADMRLTNEQHKDASGANIANYTYAYDLADRLTAQTLNGTTTSYQYDADNQLTQGGATNYGYDSNGNRNTTGYQTGANNQMTNDGTWTNTYDADGNMVKKSKGASAETWTFGYDARNHLVWAEDRATDGGSLITRLDYKYDVLENRIEKDVTANSVTTVTRFAYDGQNVWADLNSSNALQVRRLFLDNVDSVFARLVGTTGAWYVADRLGSIQDIENYAGTMVLDAYTWDAYGQSTSESNSANGDRYGFTGREREKESGQQFNHHRFYDPTTGRWTTEDPIGFAAPDVNLLRYARNDPSNATDPTGLFSWLGAWEGYAGTGPHTLFSPIPTIAGTLWGAFSNAKNKPQVYFTIASGIIWTWGDPPWSAVGTDGEYIDADGHWTKIAVEGNGSNNNCNCIEGNYGGGTMTVYLRNYPQGIYEVTFTSSVTLTKPEETKGTIRWVVKRHGIQGSVDALWEVSLPPNTTETSESTEKTIVVSVGDGELSEVLIGEPIIAYSAGHKGQFATVKGTIRITKVKKLEMDKQKPTFASE
jgi:RHS repeat-associated protein